LQGIAEFLPHLTERGLVLQAGGASGAYPAELAKHFEKVITVEPNAANYKRLTKAVATLPNVVAINAGLWNEPGRCSTKILRNQDTHTSYIVKGDEVPLTTIDDVLAGEAPDLIWLDIEGSEHKALRGAVKALASCNVVIIEQGKNLERNVSDEPGSAPALLLELGFKNVFSFRLDHLYVRG
jgi:FkbM family methyltransferase